MTTPQVLPEKKGVDVYHPSDVIGEDDVRRFALEGRDSVARAKSADDDCDCVEED